MVLKAENFKVDLTNCDREPIHLLGHIQSHGLLFGFSKDDKNLQFLSNNAREFIDSNKNDRIHISDLFSAEIYNALKGFNESYDKSYFHPKAVQLAGKPYNVYISDSHDDFILELEPSLPESSPSRHENMFLNDFLATVENTQNIEELASSIAISYRKFTHFARVMVYRFDENGNGEVIGEDKDFGLESFLGLRYPSSDIPQQARHLYKTNLIREIKDVNDTGIAVEYFQGKNESVDLSYSIFRSVSPIHIEYLKNMGVTATFAISILKEDGDLWGMIICHHYNEPKNISFSKRFFSLIFSRSATQSLRILKLKFKNDREEKATFILDKIRVMNARKLNKESLETMFKSLSEIFQIQGMELIGHEDNLQIGKLPKEDIREQILANFYKEPAIEIKHSNHLQLDSNIAGVMIIPISLKSKYLLLYRIETEHVINWAGNPNKAMIVSGEKESQIISPRKSFDLYIEIVKGYSEPWFDFEIHIASQLQDILIFANIKSLGSLLNTFDIAEHPILDKRNNELKTEAIRLHEELSIKNKTLAEYRALSDSMININAKNIALLSNMSHEMRTPLNGIMGLAQLIKMEKADQKQREKYSELILQSGERLIRTVNRILEMARLEKDSISFNFKSFDLKMFLSSVIDPLRHMSELKGQEFTFVLHNKKEVIISDPEFLTQIITNLISNAIKYTKSDGKIEVNCKIFKQKHLKFLRISVEDNGKGISEDIKEKIFEPFFMESENTRSTDQSSGLGLYLVKKYTDYLNGKIELESIKNKGSVFTVSIPINPILK